VECVAAKQFLRGVNESPASDTLAQLDAAHARLATERANLTAAREAAQHIADEPITSIRTEDWLSVGELPAVRSGLRHPELDAVFAARASNIAQRSLELLEAASSLLRLLPPVNLPEESA
jgi:hypothetical protein